MKYSRLMVPDMDSTQIEHFSGWSYAPLVDDATVKGRTFAYQTGVFSIEIGNFQRLLLQPLLQGLQSRRSRSVGDVVVV